MDRLGLGYEDLRPKNRGLVYLSASGYGHEGPRRDWTSMNLNLQAYSGLMMTTGEEGDAPTTLAASWNDFLGALHGCVAVLNALVARKKSGLGANLDLSQFECSVASLGALLMASAFNKSVPSRTGNRSPDAAPQGVYRCAGRDDWCAISVRTDEQWNALAEILGLQDDRFAALGGRLSHHDEIDDLIERWTCERTPSEAEKVLNAAGIPAERMRRSRDVLAEPGAASLFPPVEDPPGYRQRMSRAPLTFSRNSLTDPSRAPQIGEDTADVLREWLGIDDIASLEAEGALI
jgi:benzylsuccinate CoA-transferase BbsF subunit